MTAGKRRMTKSSYQLGESSKRPERAAEEFRPERRHSRDRYSEEVRANEEWDDEDRLRMELEEIRYGWESPERRRHKEPTSPPKARRTRSRSRSRERKEREREKLRRRERAEEKDRAEKESKRERMQLVELISSLQESQRQLQEQVHQLTVTPHTLESDGGGGGDPMYGPPAPPEGRLGSDAPPVEAPRTIVATTPGGGSGEALAQHLLDEEYPPGWRAPKIPYYRGDTDPEDHLHSFKTNMEDRTNRRDIWCRMFRRALTGDAIAWYRTLPTGSVHTYEGLVEIFRAAFAHRRRRPKIKAALSTVIQGESESTRTYIDRFASEVQKIEGISEEVVLYALTNSLRPTFFAGDLVRKPPKTFVEAMERSHGESNVEDYLGAKIQEYRRQQRGKGAPAGAGGGQQQSQPQQTQAKPPAAPQTPVYRTGTPAAAGRREAGPTPAANQRQVFLTLIGTGTLPLPRPMRKDTAAFRDTRRFCEYHEDNGHTTAECLNLAKVLSKMKPANGAPQAPTANRPTTIPTGHQAPKQEPADETIGDILTIAGGGASRGDDPWEGRRYASDVDRAAGAKRPRINLDISFTEDDMKDITTPHDDPLVITPIFQRGDKSSVRLHRVLVDTGASVDILYWNAFVDLGLARADLLPCRAPIRGFGQSEVPVAGTFALPVTLGRHAQAKTVEVTFTVFNFTSGYNAILGRTALHAFQAVMSSLHQCLKFPTEAGVCTVRGSQKKACECYFNSVGEVMTSDEGLPHSMRERTARPEPASHTTQVTLGRNEVQVGKNLPQNIKEGLEQLLKKNEDLFASELGELGGVPRTLAEHRLAVAPDAHPVRQKLRPLRAEKREASELEVRKLLQAGFIRPVRYPAWLSNVVMVRKADSGWRMCVDFTNLNKTCPKDSYPLPSVDRLVDQSSGCGMLSFMDAHSGYNQVPMAREDEEKTSFITEMGTFCFRVMPFGLRNAGATFQRLMDKIFKEQIGRNVEVYVDDILVRSKEAETHLADLEESFANIRSAGLKLKAKKCAFGVKEGHFLGFRITPEGIKPREEKVEAVMAMNPPRTLKEVQKLNGRVAALSRFLPRTADRLKPFFQLLRNPGPRVVWSDECERAFKELKRQLSSLPTLRPPTRGEPLTMYVACSEAAVSAVLISEAGGAQRPVYYHSRSLVGAEERYPEIEKLALAVVSAVRRLKPYFHAHTVTIPTAHPLLQLLQKPDVSGRLTKWVMELSEFHLVIVPARAVKGQAVADFMAELAPREVAEADEQWWTAHVDGSSSNSGCGAGVVVTSPTGEKIEYSIHFEFRATNNAAEYEALLSGIRLTRALGASKVHFHTDSRLVANQVRGDFVSKEDSMASYVTETRVALGKLKEWRISQIGREHNGEADTLAKLGASPGKKEGRWIRIENQERLTTTGDRGPARACGVITSGDWRTPITRFILTGETPTDPMEARKLRNRAAWFVVAQDKLYRRSAAEEAPLRLCVPREEGKAIARSLHEGASGAHQGGRALEKQVARQGYYWPESIKDSEEIVGRCDVCQRHSNVQRRPSTMMKAVTTPVPFARWGIDIVGPFPPASRGRKFLFVAVDYFTKWAEAEATNTISEQNLLNFVFRNIVCRFGVPIQIITDNGTQFTGKKLREFCEDSGIKLSFAPVYHPQANGQVEVTNRTITSILKRKVGEHPGNWADLVPETMWAYRTTIRTPTGQTPFALAFGMEAVAPAELVWPTARIEQFQPGTNDQAMFLEREHLEGRREEASIRDLTYKRRVTRYHNERVADKSLAPGDLVLRNGKVTGVDQTKGKLSPKWEGPYVITDEIHPGIFRLGYEDGQEIERTWHADNLEKYRR